MSLFHSILSQLQEKINKESVQTEQWAVVISEIIGTTITAEQLTVQGTTLRVLAPSTIKMAIMLNKAKILERLKEYTTKITTIA